MVKQKWYVVTVGREVGVFSTWLEAGKLVKGVPEALHQSFSTKEEAYCVFLQEQAKGNTKVVKSENIDSQKPSTSPSTRPELPRPSADFNHRPIHISPQNTSNMQRHVPQDTHEAPTRASSSKQPSFPSPNTYDLNRVSGTYSDPSLAGYRRLRAMKMVYDSRNNYKRDIGIETGASPARSVQASTPISRTSRDSSSSSPSKWSSSSQSSRVVVKTPSWLAPYPRSHQSNLNSLSPLNSSDIHLNSLSSNMVNIDDAPGCKSEGLGLSPVCSPSGLPLGTGRAPDPITTYDDIDPRSPILKKSQVSELAFVSPIYFTRPSPIRGSIQLPSQSPSQLESSVLFQIPSRD